MDASFPNRDEKTAQFAAMIEQLKKQQGQGMLGQARATSIPGQVPLGSKPTMNSRSDGFTVPTGTQPSTGMAGSQSSPMGGVTPPTAGPAPTTGLSKPPEGMAAKQGNPQQTNKPGMLSGFKSKLAGMGNAVEKVMPNPNLGGKPSKQGQ